MRHKILSLFVFLSLAVASWASDSVLSTGRWYKVGVSETGIHQLTYSDLSSLGVDVDHVDPRNIRLFHNGGGVLGELNARPRCNDLVEIPVVVSGESDGKFDSGDYILFYARGPVVWSYAVDQNAFVHHPNDYDDYAYVFLTIDQGRGKRIQTVAQPSGTVEANIAEFLDYQVYEKDNYNIIHGGRTFYGDIIDGNGELKLHFDFPHASVSRPCSVNVDLAGRNFNPASFQLYVNGSLLKTFNITVTSNSSQQAFAYAVGGMETTSLSGDEVEVKLKHVGLAGTLAFACLYRSADDVSQSSCFRCVETIPLSTLRCHFSDSGVGRH